MGGLSPAGLRINAACPAPTRRDNSGGIHRPNAFGHHSLLRKSYISIGKSGHDISSQSSSASNSRTLSRSAGRGGGCSINCRRWFRSMVATSCHVGPGYRATVLVNAKFAKPCNSGVVWPNWEHLTAVSLETSVGGRPNNLGQSGSWEVRIPCSSFFERNRLAIQKPTNR